MNSIKVGPIIYPVKTVEGLKNKEGEELHGRFDDGTHEIYLNSGHINESRFVSLWHEVIHSTDAAYGLHLSERSVTALASIIAQILQDNPEMNWQHQEETKGH